STFMSGRDPDWVQLVDQAVRHDGGYYDRSLLAMGWVPTNTAPIPTITLSNDLQSAELVTTHHYTIDIGNGLSETVQLAETAVYRLGPNRWLLSPPEQSFWGRVERKEGQIVAMRYPERDAELVKRLVLDIDTKLIEMCARFSDLACPENLTVEVQLVPQFGMFPQDMAPVLYDKSRGIVHLTAFSTPSVLGVPVNEAGYQALYRGYASQVVTAVIDALLDVDCCQNWVLYQAVRADYLHKLSLQPWPLTAVDYERAMTNPVPWDDLDQLWQMETVDVLADEDWLAFAAVDFLLNEDQLVTFPEMLHAVDEFSDTSFTRVIQDLTRAMSANMQRQQSWQRYLYEHSQMAEAPLPVPLPDQAVYALCRSALSPNLGLYKYTFSNDRFVRIDNLPTPTGFMLALPDDSGTAVGERIADPNEAALYFWEGGMKTSLSWSREVFDAPGAIPYQFDPTGTKLILRDADFQLGGLGLMDYAECIAGDACDISTVDSVPVWSPSGELTVIKQGELVESEQGQGLINVLYVGDADGQVPEVETAVFPFGQRIGKGYAPFWQDDTHVGYLHLYPTDESPFMTALSVMNLDSFESELQLTAADLLAQLPVIERPEFAFLKYAALNPLNQDEILIATAATGMEEGSGHLFVYNVMTKEIQIRLAVKDPADSNWHYRFSPDGRYFLLTTTVGLANDGHAWVLYLHDIVANTTEKIILDEAYLLPADMYMDWSSDGNWLSIVQDGFVRLIAPAHQAEKRLIPEDVYCSASVWVVDQ
ncbi:MAG: hypothetical protein GY943_28250, partial [Chloroflexi bacterium]|nr:hypothetical protein [Chloroflexota bacterium]